jgi:hypothetical protein
MEAWTVKRLTSQGRERERERERERGLKHQRTAGYDSSTFTFTSHLDKWSELRYPLSALTDQLTLYFRYNQAVRRMIVLLSLGELLSRRREAQAQSRAVA